MYRPNQNSGTNIVLELPQIETNGSETSGRRFRIENGDSLGEREEIFGSPSTPVLENPEYQTRWYFKYFLGKVHQNYVGADSEKVPFFLSVVLTDANNQCASQYRVILWKNTGTQKILLPYASSKPLTVKQLLSCEYSLKVVYISVLRTTVLNSENTIVFDYRTKVSL
ncbi:hypothetical protein PGB90_003754 [Kerria lacca]